MLSGREEIDFFIQSHFRLILDSKTLISHWKKCDGFLAYTIRDRYSIEGTADG